MPTDETLFSSGQKSTHESFVKGRDQVNGVYLTLEQSTYSTRIAQGALFAF
jgi:hypothetical protein